MPPIMPSLPSYPSTPPTARSTLFPSIPEHSTVLNSTTMSMTRNSSLSMRRSGTGDNTWRAPETQLKSLPTTKISSISPPQNFSPAAKPNGPNTSASSTSPSAIAPVNLVPSLTPSLDDGMSTQKGGIATMPQSTHKTFGPSSPPTNSNPLSAPLPLSAPFSELPSL